MAHVQKPDFIFRRNGRVHLNRQGRQFSRLLAAEVCASAVVMLDTPCSVVVWRVMATHSIRQFPLHFPSPALPCAITFQLDSTCYNSIQTSPSKDVSVVVGKGLKRAFLWQAMWIRKVFPNYLWRNTRKRLTLAVSSEKTWFNSFSVFVQMGVFQILPSRQVGLYTHPNTRKNFHKTSKTETRMQ